MTRLTSTLFICLVGLSVSVASCQAVSTIWISPSNTSTNLVEEFWTAKGEWTANQHAGVGGRAGGVINMDSHGLIWIFGGWNFYGDARAMWSYNPLTNEYRWVAGSESASEEFLGNMGEASPDVFPGPVAFGTSAIDNNDNIWIYGGYADAVSNKLFMFNTTSLEFTWIGGDNSNTAPQTGNPGEPSANVWPGVLFGACMKADSKGDVWLIGGYYTYGINRVWHFNTTSRYWTFVSGTVAAQMTIDYSDPQWNGRVSSACTIDTNDRIWVFGGIGTGPQGEYDAGWGDMWSFDTRSRAWTLEFGSASSFSTDGSVASLAEYSADNYPAAKEGAHLIDRRDDTLMLYGGFTFTFTTTQELGTTEDVWMFNKTSKLWKIVAGNSSLLNTEAIHGNYRDGSASIGSRGSFAAATDLTNRGNFFIFGGEVSSVCCFADMWLIEQDECAVGTDNCDTNAQCTNTQLGFTCTCDSGYSGDGVTCDDVNECLDGTDNCGTDEECVNTSGSFTCQPVTPQMGPNSPQSGPQSSSPQVSPQSNPNTPQSTVSSASMVSNCLLLAIVYVVL